MQCRLIYDSLCPICTNYVNMLKRKLPPSDIQFVAAQEKLDDFKFILDDGSSYSGKTAVEVMAKRFPVLLDYMWLLPEKMRIGGLKAAYAVSSAARTVLKKVKGCNCGR